MRLLVLLSAVSALILAGCRHPEPGPAFVDVAARAGLDYRWRIPGPRPINILQGIGNGCAFLDYDNDGNLDIFLAGSPCALFHGDGRGHFTDVSRETGIAGLEGDIRGVAVGDYDGDGFPDLFLSGHQVTLLLHNESGKRFEPASVPGLADTKARWTTSCAWGDIDGDGWLDLYVGSYVTFDSHSLPQMCRMQGLPVACGPHSYTAEVGALYRNLAGRQFVRLNGTESSGRTLGVAFADYDNSGRQSIAVGNDAMPGDLLQNHGASFENVGEVSGTALGKTGNVQAGMGLDWGDYDNDGRPDLIVATFQHETKSLYHNEQSYFTEVSGDVGLAPAAPYLSFGIKWLDIDNDGWLDLMIASGHVQSNAAELEAGSSFRQPTLLFKNEQGRFHDVSPKALSPEARRPIVGRGLAVGDYDNDGRVDALVVDSDGTPLLLHNVTANAGHWVGFRLDSPASGNRAGIGATVIVTTKSGRRLYRQCQTGGSYLSSSDSRVHFGLGEESGSVMVTVGWPDGTTTTWRNIAIDGYRTLTQGKDTIP